MTGDDQEQTGHGPDARRPGRLYVVGTPIGNLSDLSGRAAEILTSVDVVVCEDSRRTGRLISHLGAKHKPVYLVANEHTEVPRLGDIVARLDEGQQLALVTDAGMPTISDPGEQVVRAALDAGHAVEIVPGPTAISAALAVSGLSSRRFVFEGFLPRKGRERADRLAEVGQESRTIVLYEAPHRLRRTLSDLAEVCGGDRAIAVARELTKLHEEVLRSSLTEAAAHFAVVAPRGEFVLVLAGRPTEHRDRSDGELLETLSELIESGATRRDAVADVVAKTGEPKRRVYDLATTL